jgi:hypothetical protein
LHFDCAAATFLPLMQRRPGCNDPQAARLS